MTTLTAERLRELLDYDPATGVFTWTGRGRRYRHKLRRRGSMALGWNKRGYLFISIDNEEYFSHRLAWLHVHGKWPIRHLDHKNNVTTDNRLDNLREAVPLQNSGNRGPNKNNKSRLKGVFLQKGRSRWTAQISLLGKHTHLGMFDTAEDAARAYDAASVANFGEFAKTNKALGLIV